MILSGDFELMGVKNEYFLVSFDQWRDSDFRILA